VAVKAEPISDHREHRVLKEDKDSKVFKVPRERVVRSEHKEDKVSKEYKVHKDQ
jgi:hypothetical protein